MKALLLSALLLLSAGFLSLGQSPTPPPVVSPELQSDGAVVFRVRASQAREVALRAQWNKDPVPMTRAEEGVWSVRIDKAPAGVWEYSFAVDGLNLLDPLNPSFKPQREPQRSILHVPSSPLAPWDWQ